MSQHTLYLASVWIHILAAAVWIGGAAFIALVLVPSLKRPDLALQAPEVLRAAAYRFRAVGWISLGLLAVTGIGNLVLRGIPVATLSDPVFWGTGFGRTLAIKLGLVALILVIGGLHDFVMGPRATAVILADPASERAARARRTASMMGRISLLLGLGVVAAAVALVRGA